MAAGVTHNAEKSRYELIEDGESVYSRYVRHGDTLAIVHTYTPPALRGRGLATRLVEGMLADVRARGLRIDPQCSFIVRYFAEHPEVRDLLASGRS